LEHDVFRLDVAVDNVVPMRVVERGSDAANELERLFQRNLTLAEKSVTKGLALDDRHDVKEVSGSLARIEERNDVRVVEPGRELDLSQKAIGAERGAQLGMQHFESDAPIMTEIVRQIDGRHSATTKLALQFVARG